MIILAADLTPEEHVRLKMYMGIPKIADTLENGNWEVLRCRADNTHLRRIIPPGVETIDCRTTSATASEQINAFNLKFKDHEKYELHSWIEDGSATTALYQNIRNLLISKKSLPCGAFLRYGFCETLGGVEMRIQFGTGQLYCLPGSFSGGTFAASPVWFATLQDVDITIDATIKELRGQFQFPDDTAISDKKITWKAGYGRFNIDTWNNIYFGDTISAGSNASGTGPGGGVPQVQEAKTLNATTYTVTNSAQFTQDMGVIYASNLQGFVKVTGVPTVGQYNVSAGVYGFSVTDNNKAVLVSYRYSISTGRVLVVQNHVQGWGPQFEMLLSQPYQELTGSIPNYMDLYACKCGKLTAPLKRVDYLISDLEGQAFANAAGYVAEFYED